MFSRSCYVGRGFPQKDVYIAINILDLDVAVFFFFKHCLMTRRRVYILFIFYTQYLYLMIQHIIRDSTEGKQKKNVNHGFII